MGGGGDEKGNLITSSQIMIAWPVSISRYCMTADSITVHLLYLWGIILLCSYSFFSWVLQVGGLFCGDGKEWVENSNVNSENLVTAFSKFFFGSMRG